MLTVARLTAIGALTREESRGVHYRSDHPAADATWAAHTRITPCFGGARLFAAEVGLQPVGGEEPALQPR